MKTTSLLLLFAAAILFTACGREEKPAPPPASASPAQNTYLGAIVQAQQSAVKTIDVTSLNHEIELFNAQEGRNPVDLKELVTNHYIGAVPAAPVGMKIVYDSALGKVSVVKQ